MSKAELQYQPDKALAQRNYDKLVAIIGPNKTYKKTDIPEYFICPLTQTLMVEPIINEYGYTYEKKAYVNHAASKKTDPSTGRPLDKNVVYDNIAVKAAIDYYLEQ
jgi:hypothetical protein